MKKMFVIVFTNDLRTYLLSFQKENQSSKLPKRPKDLGIDLLKL